MTLENFQWIAGAMPEPMMLVTVRGRVIAFNQALRKIFGAEFITGRQYDVPEIFKTPGEQILEYLKLCSDVRQFLPGSLKLRFSSEPELDIECEGAGIDSSNFQEQIILLRLRARTAAGERIRAPNQQIGALDIEIGKRIKAEEERTRSEEIIRQQASLFDQAYDAIFVWQWKGPITFWNRGAERLYGFFPSEALGQVSHKLLKTRTSCGMATLLLGLESQGKWEGELEHVTSDGRQIDVETRMVLVREPGREYVLEVNRDITARKHAQQQLEDSFIREKAARELAEKANLAKDDFLASLSHELRTPLNPVLLIASDAVDNPDLPIEIRDNFETILKSIEIEARLIDDLLDLTHITHGKLSLQFHDVDARLILEEAIAGVLPDANAKHIQISIDWSAEYSIVHGDEVRLRQVFWNVLKNAIKFTPPNGKITVEATSANDQLNVRFTDTGIGMTQEEIRRIFDAFAQGDHIEDGRHRFGGLGLGLAISRKLVEIHSGQIYAGSAGRDRGATFVIELPVTKNGTANSVLNENSSSNAVIFPSERSTRIFIS